MTFKTRLTTAIATGAVLLNALAPAAFASTDITISGNGSNSDSNVSINNSSNTSVVQNNTANVNNNVNVNTNTGNNHANDNTGGDVTVNTGSSNSTVNLSTAVNQNHADVSNCNCNGNTTVNVSGNGKYSDNDVKLTNNSTTNVFQTNNANVSNDVDVHSNTGKNHANDNTGGDVTIRTGNADSAVSVSTIANANFATVGGNGNGGSAWITVAGNGSNSDNDVNLTYAPKTTITQDNSAHIDNDVDVHENTGKNHANDNTGGDVSVNTGDANSEVTVDNLANFNSADIDNCGCFGDLNAKIAGNGHRSDNDIKVKLADLQSVFQTGDADLDNDIDPNLKTGNNHVNDNTGEVDPSDPSVKTGSSDSSVSVDNTANQNVYGPSEIDLPGDMGMSISFDLHALLGWLGFHA